MRTQKEINEDIINSIAEIDDTFPESSKDMSEIPTKGIEPDANDITMENMRDYYSFMDTLLKKYATFHHDERADPKLSEAWWI